MEGARRKAGQFARSSPGAFALRAAAINAKSWRTNGDLRRELLASSNAGGLPASRAFGRAFDQFATLL
jgi:hypothetical protein